MNTKPWLIGESNPYQAPGADPDHKFDLYPLPPNASGGRLCRLVLGLQPSEYMRRFVRRNLIQGKWSIKRARIAANSIWRESETAPLILLGSKVCAAFGIPYVPFTCIEHDAVNGQREVAILPHPSGLSRAWHVPGAYDRARDVVKSLMCEVQS